MIASGEITRKGYEERVTPMFESFFTSAFIDLSESLNSALFVA